MVSWKNNNYKALSIITALIIGALPAPVWAQYSSSNFKIEETFIGSGGVTDSSSASYVSRASLGDLTVGRSASSLYQAYGGFTTTNQEYLEFAVIGGTFDFGELKTTSTGMGVTTFSVRNYLASGYIIQIKGTTLTNPSGGYVLTPLASTTASVQGTEQFGINLRQNTTPNIGADPVQVPDSSFSFGTVAAGYNTINQFKYVNGATIASSASSSGTTTYSMSMIANVANITPGGQYDAAINLVAVPTF